MRTKILLISFILYSFSLQSQNFVEVTPNNKGQTLNLGTDQVLEIKLQSNPSKGYGWYVTEINTGMIKQMGNWDFIPNSNNNIVGQSGTLIIRFIEI